MKQLTGYAGLVALLLSLGCGSPRRFQGKTADYWLSQVKSANPAERWQAATALGQLGPPLPGAVPALQKLLKDDDHIVRFVAAGALAAYGEEAKPAVPDLEYLRDNDQRPAVRETARESLKYITGKRQE